MEHFVFRKLDKIAFTPQQTASHEHAPTCWVSRVMQAEERNKAI